MLRHLAVKISLQPYIKSGTTKSEASDSYKFIRTVIIEMFEAEITPNLRGVDFFPDSHRCAKRRFAHVYALDGCALGCRRKGVVAAEFSVAEAAQWVLGDVCWTRSSVTLLSHT